MVPATKPATSPLTRLPVRNGLRIKAPVAPTSFIVWMVKRREYTDSLMVLFMSANDMNSSTAAMTVSMIVIDFILAFTASTISVWMFMSDM